MLRDRLGARAQHALDGERKALDAVQLARGVAALDQAVGVQDERRAVVIDEVISRSRAAEVGLASGDLIVGVNGTEVGTTLELNSQIIAGAERSSIVLSVARGRYVYNVTFPMGT